TEPRLVIADTQESGLTPAIRARAGMVVWEELPGVAQCGVVLAHGGPLALGEVRAPAVPRDGLFRALPARFATREWLTAGDVEPRTLGVGLGAHAPGMVARG